MEVTYPGHNLFNMDVWKLHNISDIILFSMLYPCLEIMIKTMSMVQTGCETADVDTGRHVIEQQFTGKW